MRYLLAWALLVSASVQSTPVANLVLTCPDEDAIGQVALESCRGYVYERPTQARVVATGSHSLKYWRRAGDLSPSDTVLVCEIPVEPGKYSSCRDAAGVRRMRFVPKNSVITGGSVMVAKAGGDYADPVVAAANAYAGDTWCADPRWPLEPCVMMIEAGVFVLRETLNIAEGLAVSGAGKGDTMLVADNGIETAVASIGNVQISDLTIVNSQPGQARATSLRLSADPQGDSFAKAAELNGLAVHVSGAARNVAIENGGSGGDSVSLEILDADITAVGQDTHGILGTGSWLPTNVTLERSHISAESALHEPYGIPGATMRLIDSRISGSVFFNPEDSLLEIVRSGIEGEVTARNDQVRIAVTDSSIKGDVNASADVGVASIRMTNTSVEGKVNAGYSRDAIFDDLRVIGELSLNDIEASVLRSRISSPGPGAAFTLFNASGSGAHVRIEHTLIEGAIAVAVEPGNPERPRELQVIASVLAGQVSADETAVLSCTDTYGADFELLSASCEPQVP